MDDMLIKMIKIHEGLSLYCYDDSLGFKTIGYGRCIDKRKGDGITQEEAQYLLQNDINKCEMELAHFSWFMQMDSIRQDVIVELCFNIGLTGVLKFLQMIASIEKKDYEAASMHLLNSEWASQVGPNRSENMAKRLETGSYGN